VCIAHDPGLRLRDIADRVGITERSAFSIVADLTDAGYVVKQKDGRRNRYRVNSRAPLPDAGVRKASVGEVLAILVDRPAGRRR